jgi:hypothetical protein
MRCCIMPLTVFHLLYFLCRWNHMIGWQLDLPFLFFEPRVTPFPLPR